MIQNELKKLNFITKNLGIIYVYYNCKKSDTKQTTATRPANIVEITGCKNGTKILFTPCIQDTNSKITRDNPIFLKEIEGGKTDESK